MIKAHGLRSLSASQTCCPLGWILGGPDPPHHVLPDHVGPQSRLECGSHRWGFVHQGVWLGPESGAGPDPLGCRHRQRCDVRGESWFHSPRMLAAAIPALPSFTPQITFLLTLITAWSCLSACLLTLCLLPPFHFICLSTHIHICLLSPLFTFCQCETIYVIAHPILP